MNINQHPTSTTPNVDIEGVLDTVESNHQRLFEIAETFRQDAPKFLLELSNCIRDGNRAGSILAATKLHDVAVLMRAEPLIEFADTAITLCLQQAWPSRRVVPISMSSEARPTHSVPRGVWTSSEPIRSGI